MEVLPLTATQGGIVRAGFTTPTSTRCAATRRRTRSVLALEARERARTESEFESQLQPRLRVYLEVTRSQLHRVPDDYIRKQTLAGAERYLTPD